MPLSPFGIRHCLPLEFHLAEVEHPAIFFCHPLKLIIKARRRFLGLSSTVNGEAVRATGEKSTPGCLAAEPVFSVAAAILAVTVETSFRAA